MISKDVQRFFHVNVNCTDFAESLAFYQLIGFQKNFGFRTTLRGRYGLSDKPVWVRFLGLPDDCDGRAALLALSDDSGSTRLDLIEWRQPKLAPERRRNLAQPGIGRICLKTSDCDGVYARLSSPATSPPARPYACIWEAAGSKCSVARTPTAS